MGLIWLASYPRSGSTWIRALLTAYLRPDQPTTLGALVVESDLARRDIVDDLLGFPSSDLRPDEFDRQLPRLCAQLAEDVGEDPYVVKVHRALRPTPERRPCYPPESTEGVVYAVRDPRDVALSLAPFLGLSLPAAVDLMGDSSFATNEALRTRSTLIPEPVGAWDWHVSSWIDAPEYRRLVIRYEDLIADAAAVLERLLHFLGHDVDHVQVRSAVARAHFHSLRAEEEAGHFLEHPHRAPSFFRSGRADGWRQSLPPDLATRVSVRFGTLMRRLGYLPTEVGVPPRALPLDVLPPPP